MVSQGVLEINTCLLFRSDLTDEEYIKWSPDLVKKYQDYLDFEIISNCFMENKDFLNSDILKFDECGFIDCFKDKLNWDTLSGIDFYNIFLKDMAFSENFDDPYCKMKLKILIEKYSDKWNWALLSKNQSIAWVQEIIDEIMQHHFNQDKS